MAVEVNYETYEIIVEVDYQEKGDSAYKIAVDEGFVGTKEEWLQSLKQPAIDAGVYATEQGDYAKQVGEDTELVRLATEQVRLDTLTAKGETEQATINANAAANNANSKATIAQTAATDANASALNADNAASDADSSAANADAKAELARQAAIDANLAKDAANTATQNANTATSNANQAATNANEKAGIAQAAATNANTAADNANGAALNIRSYINYLFGITEVEAGDVMVLAMENGYTPPIQKDILRLNNFIKQAKLYPFWAKRNLIYFGIGEGGSMDFKVINIKNPQKYKGQLFGGFVDSKYGLIPNALNTYILTGFIPSDNDNDYNLNDASRAMYIHSFGAGNTAIDGHITSASDQLYRGTTTVNFINSTVNISPSLSINSEGYKLQSRDNPNSLKVIDNAIVNNRGSISSVQSPTSLTIHRAGSAYGDNILPYYAVGASLTNQEALDERRCILNALVELDETREIINRAADEGFELPDQKTLFAMDLAIWKLKTTIITNRSLWDKTDLLLRFGYNNLALKNFARINLKNPTGSLITLVNNPIYTINGFEGDIANGAYIDTNFRADLGANNYTLNDASRGATIYKKATSASFNNSAIDSSGTNNNAMLNIDGSGQRINSGANSANSDLSGIGHKRIGRKDSASAIFYNKEVESIKALASTVINNQNQNLLIRNSVDFSDVGLMDYDMGAFFNAAETLAYRNIMNELSISLGLTPYA